MNARRINSSNTFKVNFSSSCSNFKPSMYTDRSAEEIYDEVVIYDGGGVDGYGYDDEEKETD